MWQETRDPACKPAVNWVTKEPRRMSRKNTLYWRGGIGNCEVTPQSIRPTAKSLPKRDGPRTPTAIHGALGLKVLPLEKANATADFCDENHERRVEARVQALLEAVGNNPMEEYDHATYRN
jgi:hypothetical protein